MLRLETGVECWGRGWVTPLGEGGVGGRPDEVSARSYAIMSYKTDSNAASKDSVRMRIREGT
jgi:hypothetical protein